MSAVVALPKKAKAPRRQPIVGQVYLERGPKTLFVCRVVNEIGWNEYTNRPKLEVVLAFVDYGPGEPNYSRRSDCIEKWRRHGRTISEAGFLSMFETQAENDAAMVRLREKVRAMLASEELQRATGLVQASAEVLHLDDYKPVAGQEARRVSAEGEERRDTMETVE